MKLGNAIRLARTNARLSQTQLAEALGVSKTYVSMLENDRRDPSWSLLCRLAGALSISVATLVILASGDSGLLPLLLAEADS